MGFLRSPEVKSGSSLSTLLTQYGKHIQKKVSGLWQADATGSLVCSYSTQQTVLGPRLKRKTNGAFEFQIPPFRDLCRICRVFVVFFSLGYVALLLDIG